MFSNPFVINDFKNHLKENYLFNHINGCFVYSKNIKIKFIFFV